jgi:dihydrofolate reductase
LDRKSSIALPPLRLRAPLDRQRCGFIKLGLVDEYRLFVSPVVLGGGTPYLPALDERIDLELVETQTFGSREVYTRYRRE